MGALPVALLAAGGALLVLGPPVLVILSMEGRARGHRRWPGRLAVAAMWSSLAAYAALATCAVMNGVWVRQGPWWERLLVGVARLPDFAQAILLVSGVTVVGAWWMLREEDRTEESGGPTASGAAPAPRE